MHSTIPAVTIIITCYNHQNLVVKSISSAINQTYTNIKIIIIDDFSTDHSVTIIKKFIQNIPNITFIQNNQNLGHTKSFNQILKICETDYIMDLSADDFLEPTCIEKLVTTFISLNTNHYFAVYGNCNLVSAEGVFIDTYYPKKFTNEIDENAYIAILKAENKMCSTTALLNYTIFKQLKGYDDSLAYEDLDYWVRALRTYKIKYINAILVNKTVLSNSLYRKGFQRTPFAKKINQSTLNILNKAFTLNQSKKEDFSLQSRIRFELKKNIKLFHFDLVLNLFILNLKCRFRRF